MTRSYSFRTVARRVAPVIRPVRDPSVTPLSFTCFRLVRIDARASDEPEFVPIELCHPPSAMSSLVFALPSSYASGARDTTARAHRTVRRSA